MQILNLNGLNTNNTKRYNWLCFQLDLLCQQFYNVSFIMVGKMQFCGPALLIHLWRFICFLSSGVDRPPFPGRSLDVGEQGESVLHWSAPLPPSAAALRRLIEEWHGQCGDLGLYGEAELPVLQDTVMTSLHSSASGWSLPDHLYIHQVYDHMLFNLLHSFFRW